MKTVQVFIVMLSNQGFWFGGEPGTVSVRWAVDAARAEADLTWELQLDGARLASGELYWGDGDSATLTLTPPEVRVRTTMRWVYRVVRRSGGEEIAKGSEAIDVFPANLLDAPRRSLRDKRVLVWDAGGGLARILDRSSIAYRRIKHVSELQFAHPDIVLIAADTIDDSGFVQRPILAQAKAGAGVLIMPQTRVRSLAGYRIAARVAKGAVEVRGEHPMLAGLRDEDLRRRIDARSDELYAVELPADEAALELVYWREEVASREPGPIDALLVTRTIGAGRIVLCQLPLSGYAEDPMAQLLLANALAYLTTRPEPTPRPSQRPDTQPAGVERVPTITIPTGAQP